MAKSIPKKKRISIREYQPEDRERVINLLNAPSIKPDIWKWQFDKRYFSSNIKPIVAEDNWGNILGFNGMMPVKLHTKEFGELEAAWSCDFFVSRHCRGLGVGKEIKRELKKQSPITFALGTSPTAAAVLEKSGWVPYQGVYTYNANGLKATSINRHSSEEYSDTDSLPALDHIDALWNSQKDSVDAAIVRNGAYLNWRYQQSPLARYQYLYRQEGGKLAWLAVYHQSPERVFLVDYLGPRDQKTQKAIVTALINKNGNFRCMTSCQSWESAFSELKIKKSDNPSNCFVYSEDPNIANSLSQNFYIMPGDCDGDILGSSVIQTRMQDTLFLKEYTTESATLDQLLKMKDEWDALVSKSDNPKLFSNWTWITLWWKHFAALNNFRLELILCKHKGKLVGIAPMYTRTYRQFLVLVKQMQIIGCSWSGPNTFRSEYLDLIIHKDHARHARLNLLNHIHEKVDWDELVLGDIRHESQTTRLLEEGYGKYKLYPRTVHEDHSVIVDCTIPEEQYIAKLSANFRRSALNKFKHLQQKHNCSFEVFDNQGDSRINIVDALNALHIPRWGKPCFEGAHKSFHEELIQKFGKANSLNIGILTINEQRNALSYSISYDGTVYNIQLGYDEEAHSSYSLGFIHLMQNILHTTNQETLNNFDLLAGYGKQEYYKERFGGRIQNLVTKQYLKGTWIKLVYRIYDKKRSLQSKLTSSLSQ